MKWMSAFGTFYVFSITAKQSCTPCKDIGSWEEKQLVEKGDDLK